VSAVAQDPQGVTSARVFWSVNSGAWSNAPMTAGLSGRYTGTIPGQSTGAVVQFYVNATDSLGATATFPARGRPNSGALYKVDDGQAILSLAHNVTSHSHARQYRFAARYRSGFEPDQT
jgi:hypothetical protein